MTANGLTCRIQHSPITVRNRRVLPVGARPGEGLLSQPTAVARPWTRERVFVPHICRSRWPSGPAQLGGFLPFPICLARDAQTLKAVIYYRPLRSPCPRADAASVGIQRDVPVKIWWHLVMLGSDRLKRADTVSDTTIRMRSENRDSRQLHCLETVSPRRAGELRDRGLHEPVSAGTPLDSHLR